MIIYPIKIVEKNGDVTTYQSLEEAERAVEAIDVIAGEYQAFDSSGKKLKLEVVKKIVPILFGFFNSEIDAVNIVEDS